MPRFGNGRVDFRIYLNLQSEYKRKKKSLRKQVFDRDENVCTNCSSRDDLTLDHITPLRKGGSNNLDNFQILCMDCNKRKQAKI